MILAIILVIVWLFIMSALVVAVKEKIQEDKAKKEEERIAAEKEKQEREYTEKIKAKQRDECEKNKDVDISKLPFCVEFEKEFNMSFQDFKNSFRKIELSKVSKEISYNTSITFIYNDKYFYINGLYDYDKVINKQLSLNKYEFKEIFLESKKTDYALNVYQKAKVSDFKDYLYSLDDLLYIEKYNETDEFRLSNINKTPSKLSLAVTESFYGTAAAMKKLNNQNDYVSTTNYCGGKFVFSEKTNLPILYHVSTGKSLILLRDEEKLFNLKSYERYQERMLKNSAKESNTNSSLDEIKKLKELLDCGAITQEEFDSKKKELLNLK